MLGGADNPNGELLSYIIGADKPASVVRVQFRTERQAPAPEEPRENE